MVTLRERPLFTREWDLDDVKSGRESVYIYGRSTEDRSSHVDDWKGLTVDVTYLELSEESDGLFSIIGFGGGGAINPRKKREMTAFVTALPLGDIYLDVTGLAHNTWAPLVKVFLECNRKFCVVYVEPEGYAHNPTPRQGDIFDLSERITGIGPIPLFASLDIRPDDDVCFLPLLGFEGTRLSHMLEQVQPPADKVYPLIGVPGFRPEYPFFTFLANASPLLSSAAHRNIRYANSNCVSAAFYAIEDIMNKFPADLIKIGLVGTKPHALAAVLHAVRSPDRVELVYDQVLRKKSRTSGVAKTLVYDVWEFMSYCGSP